MARGGTVAVIGVMLALALAIGAIGFFGRDSGPARSSRSITPGRDTTPPVAPHPSGGGIPDPDARPDAPVAPAPREAAEEAAESEARGFTVRVRDVEGNPIAAVELELQTDWSAIGAKTGEDGIARVTPDAPVTDVRVTSSARIHMPPPPRAVAPGEREVAFVLERSARARGRIVLEDGTPLELAAGIDVQRDGTTLMSHHARDDGTFNLYVPARGTFDLVLNGTVRPARKATDSEAAWQEFFFTGSLAGVSPGTESLRLVAHPVTFDRTLVVRVRDPDGRPMEGVMIRAFPIGPGAEPALVPTGADGTAELRALPSRPVTVRYAWGDGHHQSGLAPPAEGTVRVTPAGQTIEFRPRATVVVSGVVQFPDGTPAPRAKITAWVDRYQPLGRTWSDRSGGFELRIPGDGSPVRVGAGVAHNRNGRNCESTGVVRIDSAAGRVELVLTETRVR